MNDCIEAIMNRRSIRLFLNKPIELEKIKVIISAGIHAPSGKNLQTWHFTVIQDKVILNELICLVKNTLERTKTDILQGYQNPDFIVIVSNRKSSYNALVDGACALENMFLAAYSLGIGSCWINALRTIQDEPEIRAFLTTHGISDRHLICGMGMFGYPTTLDIKKPKKRENVVSYFI